MEVRTQDIERYMQAFETIRQRVGDDHIATAIMQELGKDARTAQLSRERQNGWHKEEKSTKSEQVATQKQLEYLRDLGVNVSQGMTKQQATELIEQALTANAR